MTATWPPTSSSAVRSIKPAAHPHRPVHEPRSSGPRPPRGRGLVRAAVGGRPGSLPLPGGAWGLGVPGGWSAMIAGGFSVRRGRPGVSRILNKQKHDTIVIRPRCDKLSPSPDPDVRAVPRRQETFRMIRKSLLFIAAAVLVGGHADVALGEVQLSFTVTPGPSDLSGSGVDLSGLDIIDVTATSTEGEVASFDITVTGNLYQTWDFDPGTPPIVPSETTPTPTRTMDVEFDSYFLLPETGVQIASGSFLEDNDQTSPFLGGFPTLLDGFGSTLESASFGITAESGNRAESLKFLRIMVPSGEQALISGSISEAIDANAESTLFNGFAVPEPASLALLGLGGLAMLGGRRRKG